MLWSWLGAPRLLVPSRLWGRLSEVERSTLLAHELAHLRRRDHWVRILEMVVTGLYWWHPVVWWARQSLRAAEEQCCDAWVVSTLPVSAPAYAKTLVETVDFLSKARVALPLAASGIGQAHFLKRRLTMIMRGTAVGPALGWAGFLVVLGLGALLLPLWPSWAQDAPATTPADEPAQAATEPAALSGPIEVRSESPQEDASRDQVGATAGQLANKSRPSEELQAARDEVGILEAQLEVKRAEEAEVRTRIGIARRRLERINALAANKAVSSEEVENAKDEVVLLEAQLAPKRAYIAEAELRLKQAHRRLESMSRLPEKSATWARPLAPSTQTAVRGGVPSTTVRPANVTGGTSPAAISAVRSAESADAGATASSDHEQRLRELEKKMDDLLKEVKALRREMRPRRVPELAK
jgi:hypothetical protein